MEKMYQTWAVAVGGRDGHVKTADGNIDMDLRMPTSMGGEGGATTPEDLFAAGWAACFNGALNLAARMNRVRTGEVRVKVSVALGKTPEGDMQLAADIEATVPGVEQDVARDLVERAHAICPYSRATRGNIETTVKTVVE